jgi:hypothetical protein
MNNKKPKKIIFIKNDTGSIQQAMDMQLYLRERQQGRLGSSKQPASQFLVGVPQSPKSQHRKNCCGRKS